jgi:hypothetical protein
MLALVAVGVSVIKPFLIKVPGAPISRANTMALGIVTFAASLTSPLFPFVLSPPP